MTNRAQAVLKEALTLPPDERAGVAAELLASLDNSAAESDFERRRRLQDEVIASIHSFRAGDRLSREDVHDRGAVR